MTSKLLEVTSLAYAYDNEVLFRGLSFVTSSSQAYQISGLNGSGKTTLLKCLAGLLSPSLGSVKHHSVCQFLSGESWQSETLTVRQTFDFWASFYKTKVDLVQREFNFNEVLDKPIKHLSKGQKQRLAFSRLLLSDARVWLLDEPTICLDDGWKKRICTAMQEHLKTGGGLIFTSHEPLNLKSKIINLKDYK